MLTVSKLPDWQTVSSLSLSWCMRRALSRNSVAEKRYPNTMEPRRKLLAAGTHPGVPLAQPPDCMASTSSSAYTIQVKCAQDSHIAGQ